MDEEKFRERTNAVIKEELSIASEVSNVSFRVLDMVLSEKDKKACQKKSPGLKYQEFSFKTEIAGKKVSVFVKHYLFANAIWFQMYRNSIPYNDGESATDGGKYNLLTIQCYSISGTFQRDEALNTIQHEIEHIFQGLRGSASILTFDKLYNIAVKNLNNDDRKIATLADLIYLSYRFEIDGFLNGLYGFLMTQENLPDFSTLKKSETYKRYLRFQKIKNTVIKNRNTYEKIATMIFGTNLNRIIKNAVRSEKYFFNRLGKVLIKVQKDKAEAGIGHLSTTKGRPQTPNI